MTVKVYLIRHGETRENAAGIVQGHRGGQLSENGIRQVELLAKWMEHKKLDCIYSSDLKRAADTSAILNRRLQCPLHFDPALREKSHGVLEGKAAADCAELFAKCWDPYQDFRAEGGETFTELRRRVAQIWHNILAENPARTVAIVTHGGVIKCLWAQFGIYRFEEAIAAPLENTWVTLVTTDDDGRLLSYEILDYQQSALGKNAPISAATMTIANTKER